MWNFVEGDSRGGEIGDRTLKLKAGRMDQLDTIRSFKNNMTVNTVTRGSLITLNLAMPQFSDNRTRTIRVWLPDGYDPTNKAKRYPVLYMHDGQNLFDDYTSFSGEWKIDESIGAMMDGGYHGTIVVGIDNGGAERLNEYSPSWPIKPGNQTTAGIVPAGEKHAAFVVETVKPYIDTNFNTLTDKANTGIGGSSMGGIISFYTALKNQDVFGYALIFSSSFWIYSDTLISDFFNETITDVSAFPKTYFYHGQGEGISAYITTLQSALSAKNIPSNKYVVSFPTGGAHNEPTWAKVFPTAYKWIVGIA